ncbi:MAG: 50S ribosomal protein L6 [Acidobacteriota bacterium]
MSRVGRKPIPIPSGVQVNIKDDTVEVQGPKGKLTTKLPKGISVQVVDGKIQTSRESDEKNYAALHGLTRALVANSVEGVTNGFRRELDIVGIGFKAEVKKSGVLFNLGYSHPIEFPVPDGIKIEVARDVQQIQNYAVTVIVSGSDRHQVGQTAANIRSLRLPDIYKGKGVRYRNERIKLKVGKKGA